MKPTATHLINLKVRYGTYENELYFDIEQIRERFPDLRFPPDKIKEVLIGGVSTKGIRQQDLQELSDFDRNMIKLYNFGKSK